MVSPRCAGTTLGAMTTTLITGANKGLGRETARRLLADGHDVWIGARDETAAGPPPKRSARASSSST